MEFSGLKHFFFFYCCCATINMVNKDLHLLEKMTAVAALTHVHISGRPHIAHNYECRQVRDLAIIFY